MVTDFVAADMQSLRMDEPDMMLMDDHDDDKDPFTGRCMSFEVRPCILAVNHVCYDLAYLHPMNNKGCPSR